MKRMICTLMALVTVFSLGLSSAAAGKSAAQEMGKSSYGTSVMGTSDEKYQSLFQGFLFGKLPSFGPGNDTEKDPDQGNTEEKDPSSNQDSSSKTCSAPTQLAVEGSGSLNSRRMNVTWKEVEGADHYVLQRSTSEDFSDGVKECTVKGTSKIFIITASGNSVYYYPAVRTYYFRVKAVCADCESDWSEVVISEGSKEKLLPF